MAGQWEPSQEEFEAMQTMLEENRVLLQALCKQLPVNHTEHMEAMRALTTISKAQLEIAQEYKSWIGDPLQRGSYALGIIRSVFGWSVGILLTLWGLKEMFDAYFIPRLKP